MYDVLAYAQSLVHERLGRVSELDQHRDTISLPEYLSCRRSLLRAIEELQWVVVNIEFQRSGCAPPVELANERKPCAKHNPSHAENSSLSP